MNFQRVQGLASRVFLVLKVIVLGIFGQLQYSPPSWWFRFSEFVKKSWLGHKWVHFKSWARANPKVFIKRTVIVGAGMAVVVAGGIGFKMYWDSRPIPDYVTISASAPHPTDPETKEPRSLSVYFSKSVARPEQLSKEISSGINIQPEIVGTWTWNTDRTLVFVPDLDKGDWQVGQKYKVKFAKDFFASHHLFESHTVEFFTEAIKISVRKSEFYIDPRNPDIKKVVVSLGSNYPVRVEDLQKHIEFKLETEGVVATSKKVPFTVTTNKYLNEIYLQSEALPMARERQTMVVTVAKGIRASQGGSGAEGTGTRVAIPTIYEGFGIDSLEMTFVRNEKFEPEQILVVRTKMNAKSEEVAAGLKMLLLPVDRPAVAGMSIKKDHYWSSPSEITPEVMALAEQVQFKLVPSETEWSESHTFKIELPPERYIYLTVNKGLKGLGGYELKDDYRRVLRISSYPQELSIMSEGSILTLSGDLQLPLLARNTAAVEFTLHRVIPEQVNHLLYQMTGSVPKPDLPYGIESQIAEKFQESKTLSIESAKATQYFSFDMRPFLNKSSSQKGVFMLTAVAIGADGSRGVSDRRLLMVTDLGILVKETASGSHEVFVQNFKTGLPVIGATVEVVGTNGITVLKSTSDGVGRASFPGLKDFTNEKAPIAFSVKKDLDQAFLPFRNHSRHLQYSRFDVGGLYETSESDRLMAMVFSDRGIYRPGETVKLGLIVRSKKGKSTEEKPPLEWVISDPQGNEIKRTRIQGAENDLQDFEFTVGSNDPTGTYTAQVYVIKKEGLRVEWEHLATQTVRVEEFQPDRMKIQVRLAEEKLQGWIKPQELKAFITLRNMFGTAAENRTVSGDMVLSPATPTFRNFKEYIFTNLNKNNEQIYTERLGEQQSNEKGEAEFTLNLTKYQASLFGVRLNLEAFEAEGGRSVRASSSIMVSPLDFVLGSKADGDLYYIKKGSERNIHVIALNPDAKLSVAEGVTVATVERKTVSVLTQDDDGTYKYQSVVKETPLSEKAFKVSAQGSYWKLDTQTPGDFTLVFRNSSKVEILKVNYTVIGESNLTKAMDRNAELKLALNKSDFKNGEEISMQITAPYTGAGLITIERDGIYAVKWFKTTSTTTVESIRVPEGIDGSAYVNVTFLRGLESNEIYMSPLSYAVAPFSISLDEHKTKIDLKSPSLVKPGQTLKIQYSANKKTHMILYGVDEGILQVARYNLPDPLSFFFQKRALQVKTYQMLDLLLPEFSILEQMQAAGGDEGFGAIGKNINPFKSKRIKPVVFWSGVIEASPTLQTYTYEVPETFNGNLKIMAVSAGTEGLGSVQAQTLVRGDLIITPNVPMFVAPQDEFVVGVSVSNQAEGSGPQAKVQLETAADDHFSVIEGKTLSLAIPEGREESREVRIKTLDKLGVGSLTFKGSIPETKAQARLKLEVSVRPSSPYLHFLKAGIFTGGSVEIENPRKLYSEYHVHRLEAAGTPLVALSGLLSYLDQYGYSCTEQLLSKSLPLLYLRSMKEYMGDEKKLKSMFVDAIRTLRTRQQSDGGFALYSTYSSDKSDPALSLYAAHYLIEAGAKGLDVPKDLLERVRNYLVSGDRRTTGGQLVGARRWAYSLYLAARLGVVNGASLAQLRRELDSKFEGQWEEDMTAMFLAGTYSLYRQEDLGEKLIKGLELGQFKATDWADYLDPLSRDAALVYIAAKHFPSRLKGLIDEDNLETLLKPINQGLYQTRSIGWLLMAFDAMARAADARGIIASLQLEVSQGKDFVLLPPVKQTPKTWKLGIQTQEVRLKGTKGLAFYSYNVAGFDRVVTPVKKGLEVARQYRNKDNQEVKSVKMGEELWVHVQVRSLDEKAYRHVAIVDLIPSGFEMVKESGSSSVEGSSTTLKSMNLDFSEEREDRMILYTTVDGDLRQFTYKIKAINKGKFITPPSFAEGMYNRDLQYLGESSAIEVTH